MTRVTLSGAAVSIAGKARRSSLLGRSANHLTVLLTQSTRFDLTPPILGARVCF